MPITARDRAAPSSVTNLAVAARTGAAPQPAAAPSAAVQVPNPASRAVTTNNPPGHALLPTALAALPVMDQPRRLPIAGPATVKRRHFSLLASFVAVVLLPTLLATAYLMVLARDQYVSRVGFSIRTEEFQSSLAFLGGLTQMSGGGGANDLGILTEFIESQDLVARIDRELDLRAAFSEPWPSDFVFAFNPSGVIEDLHAHWLSRVRVTVQSGLMNIRVTSFNPVASQQIAAVIYAESGNLVNTLSREARQDATRYAREELNRAETRVKAARQSMTDFRMRTQIVDPEAVIQGQMGVLNTLQAQLAQELIAIDLMTLNGRGADPRIEQSQSRINVIEHRIEAEKGKFARGGQGSGGEDYSTLIAQYEGLEAERQFSEEMYRVALVAHDNSLAEAQRKSRYLVAHVAPTLAEKSTSPERLVLILLTAFFALMVWAVGVLVYYSIRDRR